MVFYPALLYICSICNIILASFLIYKVCNKNYAQHQSYRKSALMAAAGYIVFSIGFLIHAIYQPRIAYPHVASAFSTSYSHICGVLFMLCFLTLICKKYRTNKFLLINFFVAILSVVAYWLPFTTTLNPAPIWDFTYLAFFIHSISLIYLFINEYVKLRKMIDQESTQIQKLLDSMMQSFYIIVTCGLVIGIAYIILPDSVLLFGFVMLLAYYFFYMIYRTIANAGENLVEVDREKRTTKERIQYRLVHYNIIAHTLILVVSLIFFYVFSDKNAYTAYNLERSLNLTYNTLWDKPSLDDSQYPELFKLIKDSPDSIYINEALKLDSAYVEAEEIKRVTKLINNMPESQYKGVLQFFCLNNELMYTPNDEITAKKIHDLIHKSYDIASGKHPIPKSIFFLFWNNCVINYSNIHQTDSVSKEAIHLMRICRQQKEPLGVMYSYLAMGYCLLKAYDYQGASENFDKALELADADFSQILGKDWKDKTIDDSDFLLEYIQTLSLNARCHVEANDTTWLSKNEKQLLNILSRTKTTPITANIYYALSIYYDKWGQSSKYRAIIERFKNDLIEDGYLDENNASANNTFFTGLYYTVLERHALRNNKADVAIDIINNYPVVFKDSTTTYYPDALLQLGQYKEAAKRYKVTIDYYYQLLNGRNRHLLKTMSSNVLKEERDLEVMQTKIDTQRERMIYNALLTVILLIMVSGLAYFLYRQRILNKNLNEALAKEEKLNQAKDIFLGNMRHELITPLNAIYGFSQVISDREMPLDEDMTRTMADEIISSSEHLVRLVDNIVEATDKLARLDHLEDVESIMKTDEDFQEKKI